MMRAAPEQPVTVGVNGTQPVVVAQAAPTAPYTVQPLQGAFAPQQFAAAAPMTPIAPVQQQAEPVQPPKGFTPPAPQPTVSHATPRPAVPVHRAHTTPQPVYNAAGPNDRGDAPAYREPARRVATCSTCGVVEGVRAVQVQGQASGLGAAAGGVLGGVLGNQVGHGNGRAIATVLGAVGGGVAGNEIEKRTRGETVYDVRVRMEDGSVRTLQHRNPPAPGANVRVEGNTLAAAPARSADEARYVRTGQRY